MSTLRRRALTGFAALTTAAALAAGAPTGAAAAPNPHGEGHAKPLQVQLLAINDLHGNLEPPKGSGGSIAGQSAGGAAYLAGHLAELRQGHPNSFTVAAGDSIGASPLISALFHDEPTIEALNAMHLDVAGVGNHEFDEGSAELRRIQNGGCHPTDGCQTGHTYAGADFPYLAANVVSEQTGKPLLPPYVVKRVKGVKVGFIGMTLKGTPSIVSAEGVRGLKFLDEAETANSYAAELQRQGVQSIVVLLHEGGFQTAGAGIDDCQGISGPVVDIVDKMAPSIDVVLTAHTHQAYNCQINHKLVTSGSSFGRLVTDVELTISSASKDVTAARADNVVVTRDARYQDSRVQSLVDYYAQRTATVAGRPVGSITADVVKANGPNGESPLGDVIADAQLAATGKQNAVAAFMNPGGIRADLLYTPSGSEGPGVVTYGEAFTVQPFNNLLTTITLTGAQIRAVLEQQYDVGRTLQPAGVRYTALPSAAAGARVRDVVIGGAPLNPASSYRITVNSFLAGGGDGFSTLTQGTDPVNSGLDLDAFTAYLGAHPSLAPPSAARITLGS